MSNHNADGIRYQYGDYHDPVQECYSKILGPVDRAVIVDLRNRFEPTRSAVLGVKHGGEYYLDFLVRKAPGFDEACKDLENLKELL